MTPLAKSVQRVRRFLRKHPEWHQALDVFAHIKKDTLTLSTPLFEEMFFYEYGRYPTSACERLWDEFLHVYRFQTALRYALILERQ